MENVNRYIVIISPVTSGANGSSLGSDESEIICLNFLVVDINNMEVLSFHQYIIRPMNIDINDNILSDEVRSCYTSLTNEEVISGLSLNDAIYKFNDEVAKSLDNTFTFMTDGQLVIRQCLFPEAWRKNIVLPEFFYRFHDLRKEFMSLYPNVAIMSIEDMINHLGLKLNESQDLCIREIYDMGNIIIRLLQQGHKFHEPEIVQVKLEQGIISKHDEINSNCSVRARGLPWQASDQDIADFFIGLNIAKGGVALCLSSQGRRNGEALLLFEKEEHRDMALKRHKHHLGSRYIEVYKASGEDFINVAGGNNVEAQEFLSRGGQVIIRMRGLPYDATAKQVMDFFDQGETPCEVLDKEKGILFVRKQDGKATGDAFVLFQNENDAQKALKKHKEVIGTRYIELFRSTTAEVQQVLNRSLEAKNTSKTNNTSNALINNQHLPLMSSMTNGQLSVLPQQLITSGTKRDCIRLRGLPYEAQVEAILEFLEDHGKNIVYQGVHMVYNSQGQPSGEAFIQMNSEHSASQAAVQKHHKFMNFGKKQRYIEVFQCSGTDMNLFLTGGTQQTLPGSLQMKSSNQLGLLPLTNPNAARLPFPLASQLGLDSSALINSFAQSSQNSILLPNDLQNVSTSPSTLPWDLCGRVQPFFQPMYLHQPIQQSVSNSVRLGLTHQILPHLNGSTIPRFPMFSYNQQLLAANPQAITLPHLSSTSSGKRSFHQAFNSSLPATSSKRNNALGSTVPSITANPTFYSTPTSSSSEANASPYSTSQ